MVKTWLPTALFLAVILGIVGSGCKAPDAALPDSSPPYSPEEALSTLQVPEGFKVELFAADPLIADPVAMDVDEHGRTYVVESHGYPDRRDGTSTIRLLRDTDGDGYPDESTVFADGFQMPKGVMAWKDGVIVTDAPDILYLEDTDGDGQADHREVLLTGFSDANPQLGVNTPIYGLDNWVYLAHFVGSDIHFPDRPDSTFRVRGNIRFRPGTREVEVLSARSQFGHTFDAWGHHLLNSNSNHLYHEVIAARYLDRNPDLLVSSATEILPEHGAAARIFPITENPEYQLFTDAGVITSACGITSYLGGLFPPEYHGATFVAENVHNLVHADRLSEAGATFTAGRMQENSEFLASTDSWFRPVNFYIGPDGALYVIDYYRDIIEQPKFLSDEVLETKDVYSGSDLGRIYRIVPEEGQAASWIDNVRLGDAATEDLVAALEEPNIWWRRNAQRLLVSRQSEEAVGALNRLVRNSSQPEARLHALWTLEGLGALEPALLSDALEDEAAGVRENAIKLAERYMTKSPALSDKLIAMAGDPDPKVRFQLLSTLGNLESSQARETRQNLLFADVEDEWVQVAALSAANPQAWQLFEQATDRLTGEETSARRALFDRLGSVIGAGGNADDARRLIRTVAGNATSASEWWRAGSLAGLARGLRQGDDITAALASERQALLELFFESDAGAIRTASLRLLDAVGMPSGPARSAALERAADVAADQQASAERRADALRLIAQVDAGSHTDLLQQLITPQEPAPVQKAAVRILGRTDGAEVGSFLLDAWGGMTPAVRTEAVDALLREQERVGMLLDAIEDGTVQPSVVGRRRSKRLMLNDDPALRRKARALLASQDGDREEVISLYSAALTMAGDFEQGKEVFSRACAQCHQVDGDSGIAFGPDLATVRNRDKEWLMTHILVPNRSIADGHELWVVEHNGGETASGIITSETPQSITIRNAGGSQVTIPRSDVQSMEASDMSAMPAGLEAQIDRQAMADLLAFLKQES